MKNVTFEISWCAILIFSIRRYDISVACSVCPTTPKNKPDLILYFQHRKKWTEWDLNPRSEFRSSLWSSHHLLLASPSPLAFLLLSKMLPNSLISRRILNKRLICSSISYNTGLYFIGLTFCYFEGIFLNTVIVMYFLLQRASGQHHYLMIVTR